MATPSLLTVLLVDDHAVVRTGLRVSLEAHGGFAVVGEAGQGETAIRLALALKPALVVMDLRLPGIGGLETIRRLLQRLPETRVLVFSQHDDVLSAAQALQVGARGYLGKGCLPSVLLEALREIAAGGVYLEPALAEQLANGALQGEGAGIGSLSTREFQVFSLMATGIPVGAVARQLSLSPKTIANYTTQIKAKLKVKSLAELARLAIQHGVVSI